jgi:hypothetical protein
MRKNMAHSQAGWPNIGAKGGVANIAGAGTTEPRALML